VSYLLSLERHPAPRVSAVARRQLFAVTTPLGHRVVLTRNRWREIVRFKHPALAGHEGEVRECLRDPEVIRASAKDPDIHLYYRGAEIGYICVVVAGDDPSERFVVTAYYTQALKQGNTLWTK
jgi:hypothetical protein